MAQESDAGQGKTLVIVESATKAKKIQPYLGDDYIVEASVGHIRDLPRGAADVPAKFKKESWARLGVNPDDDFTPLYVVSPDKKKKVADLKKKLKQCDQLYLATDPDREGEAIAWHLLEVLKPKVPVRRMVFNEITKSAILEAAENTRELDADLIDAQETRRILDRLYGYEVSPVLWKKVMPRLSAGRVQSVATRVIVQRERERMAFQRAEYWDLLAELDTGNTNASAENPRTFEARLSGLDGKRVAVGRDFGDDGELKASRDGGDVVVVGKQQAEQLAGGLQGAEMSVASVEEKPYTRKPFAPFMTSTLQQDAGRRLHFTSERTMRIAQRLYENGYITYMRTDSTSLSQQGLKAARSAATNIYGAEYVADSPRIYDRKVKNSQEAHEAIRPAGENFATPGQLSSQLDAEEFKLYDLIWKRTVASQMTDAKGTSMKVTVTGETSARGDDSAQRVEFTATGRTITFPGFLRAYEDSATGSKGGKKKDSEARLPRLSEGAALTANSVSAEGHSTNPPARYTESSLVKKMEDLGIGRPSTYASIIKTIKDRGYVVSRGNALVPSWVAFAVVGLLEENFSELVDFDFTSLMEDELDAIATGNRDRTQWLNGFYFGSNDDNSAAVSIARHGGLKSVIDVNLEQIDARKVNSLKLYTDSEGRDVFVRVGRYGPYIERRVGEENGEPVYQRANLAESTSPDELNEELAEKLFATPQGGRELGENPANGRTVVAKEGRFGPYVTEQVRDDERERAEADAEQIVAQEREAEDAERAEQGKRKKNWETKTAAKQKEKRIAQLVEEKLKPATASLFQSMDPASVTLDEALQLLSLPREVGVDPSDEKMITAQNGRYGPYLKKGNDSRSLANEEQIFSITLDEARRIYAEPKRRGRAAAQPPLKQLGDNDVSGKPMTVKDGRFGPYVTDGETNASLRRGDKPEAMTDARANELLSERRAKNAEKSTSKATKKTTKKTAKKTAKKSSAKKSTRKTSARKKPSPGTKNVVKAGSRK
ncbi:type I DNA topoisomerase [Corynebacterium massiliense]|uniref:DNA topoisomerase 1 n=1 Tax=Corynebacterium massiliense DSM 45435 TaxID=1121364 RepID=A0ABY7U569_9CORY|nr:type I DNA topoisomerase [Corynebacterium massiliense]WCZ31674.1 DNA topoisomerase 1 [Corynebacterium massiliense DSM 45435]